ncbi:MAG: bifunctional [glutamate--ammonia ligase]-adenylyl-L-tyrosine phosphorylase/[glutamate--ammonia-ligase] adenylyltransferase [Candidatus Latescibacteria bacterium]|nr:bifunctional [glutamate--ammonia ligase]-adenylyl-L-tyrosine phosphorylase/[glutamate--ammonia-ligase] adenylyltransferase [Candidatus Latescibacterota bacterium]
MLEDQELERLAAEALTCDPAQAFEPLSRLGFCDPERASQALDRLAGEAPFLVPLPEQALVSLARTGRPDQGLRHLERFVEITGSRLSLYARLREYPRLAEYLVQVLSHSPFLTDILVRNPEYLYWLFEETPFLEQALDKQTLSRQARQQVGAEPAPARRLEALRRFQRRELLRIGAAEVLGLKPVVQVGRELADLADVVIECALEAAAEELGARYGRPRNERGQLAHFGVICLGKHGGQELNYSSDVDLLFVYDEDGQARPPRGGTAVSNEEYFARLGRRLIQLLTEVSAEGFLYRVDMRLRPEGEVGPLVRSLSSLRLYYELHGQLWERQMLIKARLAAGSARVWARFRELVAPFVYPAHFQVSPQEEIRRIKERIESQIRDQPARDNNIKLRAGGIRDIEFIVQCLQLLNGRVDPKVRSHNTLEAIGQLARTGALSAQEAVQLREAYCFFRRLENLLQIEEGHSVYALPEDPVAARGLAWCLGLVDGRALQQEVEGHLERVRRIFENVFHSAPPADEEWGWLLEAEPGNPRAREALTSRGFADGEAAHRHLAALVQGGMVTSAARRHLEELLPELIASLSLSADPDQALVRFVQIVAAYGAPGGFCGLLHAYPAFRTLLIAICGSSPFLAELIRRDPGLLDGLVSRHFEPQPDWQEAPGAMLRHRNQELLRIGTDDLLSLATEEETFLRLTELAEEILQAVYALAFRQVVKRQGRPRTRGGEARFACFAGGKLGGRELDFGSDLDLFFVYEGEGQTGRTRTENHLFFTELVQELIRLLTEGDLYQVDTRLRPEGRNAPMVISASAYGRYLAQRAALWERLALSRARLVAGDAALGRKVQRAIHRFVYGGEVDAQMAREVLQMRLRLEPDQPGPVDLKRGPGGIVDIEFIAQILVLKLGRTQRELRLTSTRQVLNRLDQTGQLEEAQFLLDAYDRLRGIEKGMRLASDQADNILPEGRGLAALARSVGPPGPEALVAEVEELMRRTRGLFDKIFAAFTEGS